MKVFIVDSKLTYGGNNYVEKFELEIKRQLEQFAVESYIMCMSNVNIIKNKIDKDSLIVIFNSNKTELSDDVRSVIIRAKNCDAYIWPVALDKEDRKPNDLLSEYQSFDVWEQLRSRNLGKEYLPVIAKSFARKIMARVMPALYSEDGMIFISHRRLDGEEITAKLSDSIMINSKDCSLFRDVINVKVGDEAQKTIDEAMKTSDAFIFIHTNLASESVWVQKELRYALLRNVPILWVRIDQADISKLSIIPNDKPDLEINSLDLMKETKVIEIADEILHKTFKLIMSRNSKIFDYHSGLDDLFGDKLTRYKDKEMVYRISVPRKNYHYPQRNIEQYIQLLGRKVTDKDIESMISVRNKEINCDSVAIISDKVIKMKNNRGVVIDSIEDFYNNWENYMLGNRSRKNMEIVFSGAFPDSDEIYKQSLTDAIVIFSKSILRAGYGIAFGSHPTFQQIFFETAKEIYPENSKDVLKMYLSKLYEDMYREQLEYFRSNAEVYEVERGVENTCSLTAMRKKMIERNEVVALICLGGKCKGDKIKEGIREEINIAKESGIPVFVVGSVGGCSAMVAAELKEKNWEGINDASAELNEQFMNSVDYFALSKELLAYLDECNEKNKT